MFGSQEHGRAVVGREKPDAFFGDLGQSEEGYHLESVRDDRRCSVILRDWGAPCRYQYKDVEPTRSTHPPLSVKMLPFQPCSLCAPPILFRVS